MIYFVVTHNATPLFVCLGALFPDTDIQTSTLGRFIPMWVFFKHRGFMHSIWANIIFTFLIYLWNPAYSYAFGIGYGTHIIGDRVSKNGKV